MICKLTGWRRKMVLEEIEYRDSEEERSNQRNYFEKVKLGQACALKYSS